MSLVDKSYQGGSAGKNGEEKQGYVHGLKEGNWKI
jgi:hypothetical protein